MAKELGKDMDENDAVEALKDLDMNKDNKIGYEEFKQWWISGRPGVSTWMRKLLSLKLKAMNFLGSINTTLKEALDSKEEKDSELSESSLVVSVNKFENAGTSLIVNF
jgi:hypothetical protein